MDPVSTARFRRFTGIAAACWALLAIGLSVFTLLWPRSELTLPVHCSFVGGRAVVQWMTEEGRAAGIEPGDRLQQIDGRPTLEVLRLGMDLHRGVPNSYRFLKASGQIFDAALEPAPPSFDRRTSTILLHVGVLLVGIFYLGIGSVVWWNKPERAET